jgi:SAM-dependent methyltransferase
MTPDLLGEDDRHSSSLAMAPIDPMYFRRMDESDDELFYLQPRLVVHIDDGAIATLRSILGVKLPASGALLDLMSSWRSHLPNSVAPSRVVGLGMNRAEMADNPALTEIIVHNLNREARLPFGDREFDAALLTVSVQYLTHPIEVFAEVGRVLRPQAPFVVSFSNRMFPTKAVALWAQASDQQRVGVVARYFHEAGCFERIELMEGPQNRQSTTDPLYCIIGYRTGDEDASRNA